MVIAYMQVESPVQRSFRHAALGSSVDEILAEPSRIPVLDHDEGRDWDGHAVYWCAADKPKMLPEDKDFFRIAPVHRTTKVPEDAECEVCGIGIRSLQEMFTY
jgi:hypothetical protein